jgi:NADPH-dependent 2,4-dienoyl-CoA reductase/sulfur reductase-like enzyme/rhodanese-related sulfurtransferase
MKIVIVGGVAGGASAATRARRVNAEAEITILEKGPYISFANCGLPYHVGGEIEDRSKLLVATPELFWKRFRVAIRTLSEVIAIQRQSKTIVVRNQATGEQYELPYDRLILSPGSEPRTPEILNPLPSNAFHLWTLSDMDRMLAYMKERPPKNAVVLGGGFVGLEVVEQLQQRGVQVTLVERNPQVLKPLDPEFAALIHDRLKAHGVQVLLNKSLQRVIRDGDRVSALELDDGQKIASDLIVVAIGIRPRHELAKAAQLDLGPTDGVQVNEWMQTSDPSIYAVGDVAELRHGVSQESMRVALAGPANRAGRIAGEHAATGRAPSMAKVFGTAIVRVFDSEAGCTGMNEASLRSRSIPYRSALIQATHHASYYPGALPIHLKLLYHPHDGKLLGAQAVGGRGIDKRIDVIATAMHLGATVWQLADLDLSYAPPFASAKDPVHMAAFTACNDLNHSPKLVPPDTDLSGMQVVDVRTAREREHLPLPGAIPMEIDTLPERWMELDATRPTVVVCHSGKRAHVGACWLRGHGFQDVANLSGGMSIRVLLRG